MSCHPRGMWGVTLGGSHPKKGTQGGPSILEDLRDYRTGMVSVGNADCSSPRDTEQLLEVLDLGVTLL